MDARTIVVDDTHGDVLVVVVRGEHDIYTAPALRDRLDQGRRRPDGRGAPAGGRGARTAALHRPASGWTCRARPSWTPPSLAPGSRPAARRSSAGWATS